MFPAAVDLHLYRRSEGCPTKKLHQHRKKKAVGIVGMRHLLDDVCEMKRLYVRSAARGHGIGWNLAEAIVAEARRAGYRSMRLDTLQRLTTANTLYRSMGFREIPAYRENPLDDVLYLELDLAGEAGSHGDAE